MKMGNQVLAEAQRFVSIIKWNLRNLNHKYHQRIPHKDKVEDIAKDRKRRRRQTRSTFPAQMIQRIVTAGEKQEEVIPKRPSKHKYNRLVTMIIFVGRT